MHNIPPLAVGDQVTCAICLRSMVDSMVANSTIIVWLKPCCHKFHIHCAMRALLRWDPNGIRCPVCKQEVKSFLSSSPTEGIYS